MVSFLDKKNFLIYNNNVLEYVPVSQLDRVHGYEPCCQGFESLQAHQDIKERSLFFILIDFQLKILGWGYFSFVIRLKNLIVQTTPVF